ncbi:unnamed protein product [Chilo suppressalis]|uniref:MYND-type domain-containing protein n=1 Tax=Chilo suppressalis TaxID=168631 RepID=A0ABN8E9R5_CHISP|nr:unnamed protein product [Chilo suppressalis]
MDDISVKIEESLKDQPVAVDSPSVLSGGENDVDPLAIEENGPGQLKGQLAEYVTLEKVNAGNCDDNAKDEKLIEDATEVKDELMALQAERIKEELLKEDSNSLGGTEEVIIEKVKAQNEPSNQSAKNDLVLKETEEKLTIVEPVGETEVTIKQPTPVQTPQPQVPSPPKDEPAATLSDSSKPQMKAQPDVEMTDEVEEKVETKAEPKPSNSKAQSLNGDVGKNHKDEKSSKRRASEEVETESPLKRLCQEVEKTFPQHDTMINDYIQTATKNNIDEIQRHTEQLLSEIQTLRELAQKKEQEWNNILHLKKVKEEILLRLLRRKQVLSFEKAAEVNGSDRTDPFDYLNQAKNLAIDKSDEISGLAIKQPPSTMNPMMPTPVMPITSHMNPMSGLPPPYDKAAHMQSMSKPVFPQQLMMPGPMPGFPRDMNGQLSAGFNMPMGRQGPTKDVKSIIADYRQRNPEVTPRRGRRMKSLLNPNMAYRPIAPKMDSINSLNNLNILYNNLDMNQKAMLERLQQMHGLPNGPSFKDVLVQFASMQQGSGLMPRPPETAMRPDRPDRDRPDRPDRPDRDRDRPDRPRHRHEDLAPKPAERLASPSPRLPPPPPYPEISLLPVTTSQEASPQNSLLHGILTKNCGEITITPVQPAPAAAPAPPSAPATATAVAVAPAPASVAEPQPEKPEEVVQLDDEESRGSEGSERASPGGSGASGSNSGGSGSGSGRLVIDEGSAEPDAPLCQGCRRRDAQFVCAGCANQWYCSRDCQVAAWDEHSEMCSG